MDANTCSLTVQVALTAVWPVELLYGCLSLLKTSGTINAPTLHEHLLTTAIRTVNLHSTISTWLDALDQQKLIRVFTDKQTGYTQVATLNTMQSEAAFCLSTHCCPHTAGNDNSVTRKHSQ